MTERRGQEQVPSAVIPPRPKQAPAPPPSSGFKSLAEMADEVYAWCLTKGWEPDPGRSFGDEVALMHSEVSECLEAYRDHKFDYYDDPTGKPDDVAAEMADVLIRLLHYASVHKIDLEANYERKMKFNRTRPWRHGGRTL